MLKHDKHDDGKIKQYLLQTNMFEKLFIDAVFEKTLEISAIGSYLLRNTTTKTFILFGKILLDFVSN